MCRIRRQDLTLDANYDAMGCYPGKSNSLLSLHYICSLL
jgi:hypothetical protein